MRVAGIIAEYNPFHKGHKYQIEMARESGAEAVVIAMSGDFVQRGEPAIIDKYARTEMALKCGADLVVEIPVIYALSDAAGYAYGGVNTLNNLGVVNELIFGVEECVKDEVTKIAHFLNNPPAEYEIQLGNYTSMGMNYPNARATALREFLDNETCMALEYPNAILAIEYCKELLRIRSSIEPHPIIRKGAGYNDNKLYKGSYNSASAIRGEMAAKYNNNSNCKQPVGIDSKLIESSLPTEVTDILNREYGKSFPILPEDYSLLLHSQLLRSVPYTDYYDITDSFSARMEDKLSGYKGWQDYADRCKSKNITHASVQRLLMHAALGITEEEVAEARRGEDYIRILGLNKNSKGLMKAIKDEAKVPIISKLADASMSPQLELDIRSANIYESVVTAKFARPYTSELGKAIVTK